MVNNVLLNEILSTLKEEKKYAALRDVLAAVKPADLAELLKEVPEDQVPILFRLLRQERAAEVFVEMDPDSQERLIRRLTDTELKAVVDELAADDAADLIEDMPPRWSAASCARRTRRPAGRSTTCCAIPRTAPAAL